MQKFPVLQNTEYPATLAGERDILCLAFIRWVITVLGTTIVTSYCAVSTIVVFSAIILTFVPQRSIFRYF